MDKKNIVIFSIIGIVLILVIIFSLGVLFRNPNNNTKSGDVLGVSDIPSGEISGEIETSESGEEEELVAEPKIFSGDARPIAVMIDNEKGAWPQAGLNDAYMIYEITVEGGETRFIAFFKGKDTAKIGPVRSSRHYFLDYAF